MMQLKNDGGYFMRKIYIFSLSLVFILSSVCLLRSGDSDSEMGKRYLLLATSRTKTMQKEITAASEQGFKILMSSPTSGDEMVLLMEKLATPEEPFQYQILATTRTSTMEKELNEAGEEGFKMIPQTMIAKKQVFGGDEIVVVLEKAPKSSSRYTYRFLATQRTSTMEKEILEAEEAGYVLVGICSRSEHMAIMEKEIR